MINTAETKGESGGDGTQNENGREAQEEADRAV